MRKIAIVLLGIFLLTVMVSAEQPMVNWKSKEVKLSAETHVGAIVLPAGEYRVKHEMEASNHIMVFTLQGRETKSFRIPCTLTPRETKAQRDEQHFRTENNQKVMTSMVFAGDNVTHTF
jgi:hypothetical protein